MTVPTDELSRLVQERSLESARWLITDDGRKLVDLAARLCEERVAPVNAQDQLGKIAAPVIGPEQAASAAQMAWAVAVGRAKAVAKLGERARAMVYDSDGLQMASGAATSSYHARLLLEAGAEQVVDMTAGIGADAIAFAQAGLEVFAYEENSCRAIFLKENIERFGLAEKVHVFQGDSRAARLPPGAVIFLDPPRRTGRTRWGNSAAAVDLLRIATETGAPGILAKLSPAVDRSALDGFDGDWEFVSVDGECREALILIGRLRTVGRSRVSAVLLPSGERLEGRGAHSAPLQSPDQASFLYEPDPAVVAAGLVDDLAAQYGLARMNPGIAYLLGDRNVDDPVLRRYAVQAAFPYHKKAVQSWLTEQGIGSLVVKKRGVPDDPELVRRQFKLTAGGEPAVLILTRQGKRVWSILAKIPSSE